VVVRGKLVRRRYYRCQTCDLRIRTLEQPDVGWWEGWDIMAVFKKQGVYWIDYYVNGHLKRERVSPDMRLMKTVRQIRKREKTNC
jgi:hypothetical protein